MKPLDEQTHLNFYRGAAAHQSSAHQKSAQQFEPFQVQTHCKPKAQCLLLGPK